MIMINIKERVINGLVGQAVADAVGNPFEFKSVMTDNHILEYAKNSKSLIISDDTQMTMFGLEAIINIDNFDSYKDSLIHSYSEWYITQSSKPSKTYMFAQGLMKFPSMYSVQAPGNTCLSSINALMHNEVVYNNSKGCGSVMRLLPFLFLPETREHSTDIAIMSGDITHKHIENGFAISKYMMTAYDVIEGKVPGFFNVDSISKLGQGWTAMECVNMAIWSYVNATSFEELLTLSINHEGDSDSVAAIAGSLWGLSGKYVPIEYIEKLDVLDAIEHIISRIK